MTEEQKSELVGGLLGGSLRGGRNVALLIAAWHNSLVAMAVTVAIYAAIMVALVLVLVVIHSKKTV